jgi:SAM-dependent methyltransferase
MEPHLIDDLAYKERFYWWHCVRRENLLRLLGPTLGGRSRVLEIGSGTGANLRAVRDRYDQIIGLDIDFKALRYCRDLTTIRADALDRLPFADGVFDAIILLDVLEHISDTDVLVSEIARVLRRLEYSFSWRYPVVWSFRMMMRRRRLTEGHSDFIEVPRPVNALLVFAGRVEALLQSVIPIPFDTTPCGVWIRGDV